MKHSSILAKAMNKRLRNTVKLTILSLVQDCSSQLHGLGIVQQGVLCGVLLFVELSLKSPSVKHLQFTVHWIGCINTGFKSSVIKNGKYTQLFMKVTGWVIWVQQTFPEFSNLEWLFPLKPWVSLKQEWFTDVLDACDH